MTEGTKSNAVPIGVGAVAAVAIGVGVMMYRPAPETPAAIVQSDSPVQVQAPEATEIAVVATPEPAPIAPAPEPEPEPVAPPPPVGPLFDTFRVEPDGGMVIAGRAEPGQEVAIMLGGAEVDRVTADGSGNFVALPMAGPSQSPRNLMLVGDPDGASTRSETSYIVAPIAAPAEIIAQMAAPALPTQTPVPEPVTNAPLETTTDVQLAAPAAPAAPNIVAEPVTAPEAPVAPTVLLADSEGVRVVQSGPVLTAPNVGLDAITYDPEGEVQLSGRATGNGSVQIYLDNEPLTTSPVTQGGDWRIDLPQIETGIYTLRVDEVDDAGDVVSRLETPFKREEASDVAAVLAEETSEDGFGVAVRTVQPGSTLWAI
ncbi:peptidoglycan-binding protein, partial [Pseudophaeobacter arcticus]|uniref:peptidoglycan-binding protein n=1 Tax=Pseudophaeobacter arcticus TaxID=385492 RepID=UPI002490DB9E